MINIIINIGNFILNWAFTFTRNFKFSENSISLSSWTCCNACWTCKGNEIHGTQWLGSVWTSFSFKANQNARKQESRDRQTLAAYTLVKKKECETRKVRCVSTEQKEAELKMQSITIELKLMLEQLPPNQQVLEPLPAKSPVPKPRGHPPKTLFL
jgi:hypothetical protein